jgi:peptidyl-prolyl cis-trans isomerase B (cyclophilin B)
VTSKRRLTAWLAAGVAVATSTLLPTDVRAQGKQTPPPAPQTPAPVPPAPQPGEQQQAPAPAPKSQEPNRLTRPVVTLETEKGAIKIELYPEEAPVTVRNFITLIKKSFYDGLIFHRVMPGFVAQGGDPQGNGLGGPGYTIPDEKNKTLKHKVGAVAMAKTDQPNSAGSQFYIVITKPADYLDGNYTVFGQVIQGQDVAERLRVGDKMLKVAVEEPAGAADAALTAPDAAPPAPKVTRAAEPTAMFPVTVPVLGSSKPLKTSRVKVKVTVEADGKPKVQLRDSTGIKEIDKAILEALNQWRWSAALKDGKPVKSEQTFRYDFLTGARTYE